MTTEDLTGIPPEHQNRLGVRLWFDTNFVTDESPAAIALRKYDRDGWTDLARTDTVDTELGDKKDEQRRSELLEQSAPYPEYFGPAVFDHSRFDHSVFSNADDDDRRDRVFAILFPDSDPADTSTGRSRRKIRDAMHLATAIRCGGVGFITRDGDMLSKVAEIRAEFDDFRVMEPEEALAFVERMKARYDARSNGD